MAQLIKLQDYVSRYEWDYYRYPTQYIRMKQDNWKKLYAMWERERFSYQEKQQQNQESQPNSTLSKWRSLFKKETVEDQTVIEQETPDLPDSIADLKYYFLDKLFPLQLKWATSTVTDVSFMDQHYYHDEVLKYFLQRFPDTYLVMYYPIFHIKKAPVDGEIILLSPHGIEIIYLLEKTEAITITATDKRSWEISNNNAEEKILSPIFALKRTDQIIRGILKQAGLTFPIEKVVLSRRNDIKNHSTVYNTKIIGKQEYKNWFTAKRKLVSPLKHNQLKVAGSLLQHCQTSCVKRPEWENNHQSSEMNNWEL